MRAMSGWDTKLFGISDDGWLYCRESSPVDVLWSRVGSAPPGGVTVGLAAYFGRLFNRPAAVRAVWCERHGGAMFPADMETETDSHGRIVCRPRGGPKAEPFPPVSVAIADGKVAAFSAFADRVGIALLAIAKNATPEAERAARTAVACAALADALRIPTESCAPESLDPSTGAAVVVASGTRYRVQTARQKDAVVATTLCEGA